MIQRQQLTRPLIVIILLLSVVLAACEKQNHVVHYEVTGTATDIAINYRNGSNATEATNVAPGWRTTFETTSFNRVVLHAANRTNSGSVGCRITVDGEVVAEGSSDGAYKHVHCAAMIVPPTPTPELPPTDR